MEFLFRQRYAADCKNIAQISMTITNVAKPKKRPARKQPKSEPIDVSAEATVESSNPGLNEAAVLGGVCRLVGLFGVYCLCCAALNISNTKTTTPVIQDRRASGRASLRLAPLAFGL